MCFAGFEPVISRLILKGCRFKIVRRKARVDCSVFCVLKFNSCTFKLSVFLGEPNVNLKSSRSRSNFVFSKSVLFYSLASEETDDSKE